MRGSFVGAAAIAASLLLSACSANHNTAFRDVTIGPAPTALIVDAKQRMVLSAYHLLDSNGQPALAPIRRFCSEPSPDVFSVIAQAMSAGGSFGQTADPASIEAALNMAFSSAENGSTIPRTQTINMLREMMFRTCERYLSGGYDATELSIQAARDQRIMVSILAIEQLTGAVSPNPVVLGASGSASSGMTGEALVRLDNARTARTTTETAYQAALAAYATENTKTDVSCDSIAGNTEAEMADGAKARWRECKSKRDARDTAKTARDNAAEYYTLLSTAFAAGGVSASTALETLAEGGLGRAHTDSIKAVADTVGEIVARNFNDASETLMFCQRVLNGRGGDATSQNPRLIETCLAFMVTYVNSSRLQLQISREELQRSALQREVSVDARFTSFWRRWASVFPTPQGKSQMMQFIRDKLIESEPEDISCFQEAQTEVVVRGCFANLSAPERRELAGEE